jgi:hypothetical protein
MNVERKDIFAIVIFIVVLVMKRRELVMAAKGNLTGIHAVARISLKITRIFEDHLHARDQYRKHDFKNEGLL